MRAFLSHPYVALALALAVAATPIVFPSLPFAGVVFYLVAVILVLLAVVEVLARRGFRLTTYLSGSRDATGAHLHVNFGAWMRAAPSAKPVPVALGFLDYDLDLQRTAERATKLLLALASEMTRQQAQVVRRTERTDFATMSPTKRLKGAKRIANDLDSHAGRMSRIEARYQQECLRLREDSAGLLRTAGMGYDFHGFATSQGGLEAGSRASKASTEGYKRSVLDLRALQMSQSLNAAAGRVVVVLDRLLADYDMVIGMCRDGQATVAERTGQPTATSG